MKTVIHKLIISIFCSIFTLTNLSMAQAFFNFTPSQNLSNTYNLEEETPTAASNYSVWSSTQSPTSTEVHLYNTIKQQKLSIVKNGYVNSTPHASGNLIVYQSARPWVRNCIYLCKYDPATNQCPEQNLSWLNFRTDHPYVKDNHVLWAEKKTVDQPYQLKYCYFDESQNKCTNLQTIASGLYEGERFIMVGNDTVLWSGSGFIYAAKLNTSPIQIKAVLDSNGLSRSYHELAESNGKIAFRYSDQKANQSSIVVCDLDTTNLVCLNQKTIATMPSLKNVGLDISGDNIVYQDTSSDEPSVLRLYSLKMDVTVDVPKDNKNYMASPVLDGNRLTFIEGGMSPMPEICSLEFNETIDFIQNGSFENGKDPWKGLSANEALVTESYYEGKTSLKMTLITTKARNVSQTVGPIKPFWNYEVSAALRTQIVESGPQAYIQVEWRKASGGVIRTDTFGFTGGTSAWAVKKSALLKAPAEAAKADVTLIAPQGSGAVYFDAVSFKKK